MEDQEDCSNSDTKLSESWTLVTDDNSELDNMNCEAEESSDAESLEVLEVEQAEPEKNTEDNSGSEIPCNDVVNESNCIHEIDIPIFHIIAAHKTRKYVHHANPYINMWLSIMMVVAIAITLGLGMGHYLGTKRFSKATDLIQHLQCKNHILEMEFSKLAAKHKTCVRNLHDTENIFNSLMSSSNEIEFPVEEKINEEDLPHHKDFNKLTSITPLQYETGVKGDPGFSFEKICFFNQNFSNSARMKGDRTDNHILLSNTLRKNTKNLLTPVLNTSFAILKTKLSSLHSLMKKWSQYINDIYSKSAGECRGNNDCKSRSNATEYPQNTSCKSINYVNNAETNNEHPYVAFNSSAFTSSHNDCYRSQFNLRKRCEDKLELQGERNKLSGSMNHFPSKDNVPYVLGPFPEIIHKTNIIDSNCNKHKSRKEIFKIFSDFTGKYIGVQNIVKSKLSPFRKTSSQIKRNNIGKVYNNGGMFQKLKFNCNKNGSNHKCANHEFLGKQNEPPGKRYVESFENKKYFHNDYYKKFTKKFLEKYSKSKEKKFKHSKTQYSLRHFNGETKMKQNKAKFRKSKDGHYNKSNYSLAKYAAHKIKKVVNYSKSKDNYKKYISHKDFKSIKRNKHLNKDGVHGSHSLAVSFNYNEEKKKNHQNYLKYSTKTFKKHKKIYHKDNTRYPFKQEMNAYKY